MRAAALALLLAVAVAPAHAQAPVATESAGALAAPAPSSSPAQLDASKLGISMSRIQRGLRMSEAREQSASTPLKLEFQVQVFGTAPRVDFIEDFDIKVPDGSSAPGNRSYVPGRPVTMKVTGDLRDSMSGRAVARVITYHLPEMNPNNELRLADRVAIAQEQRRVYAEWSLITREAIDVAKAAKPRTPQPGGIETR